MLTPLRIMLTCFLLITVLAPFAAAQEAPVPTAPADVQEPAGPLPSRSAVSPEAVFVVIIGLLLLIMGWKLYKFMLSITGLLLGLGIAHLLGQYFPGISSTVKLMIVVILGVGGFILAFPFQKAVIFFLGGLGGSILAGQVSYATSGGGADAFINVIIAMAIGFLLFGLLSIYFFKSIIIVSTSLIGSFGLLLGLYHMMSRAGFSTKLVEWVDPAARGFFFFLLIALCGVLIQNGINKVFPESKDKPAAPAPKAPEPPAGSDRDGD